MRRRAMARGFSAATEAKIGAIEARACAGDGHVRARDARAARLSKEAVGRLLELGRWQKVDRGVYRVDGAGIDALSDLRGRLHAAGDTAFARGRAAARVLGGLDLHDSPAVEIAV